MTAVERYELVKKLEGAVEMLRALPIPTPCGECHWYRSVAYCSYWKDRIPADIEPRGCDKWEPGVPF